MNNLRELRRARKWTQEQAAAALGTTRNQYVKLENGSRQLSEKWIDRAAQSFCIDAGDIVRSRERVPEIVGIINIKGHVSWSSDRQKKDRAKNGLKICGSSFGANLDGWIAILSSPTEASQSPRSPLSVFELSRGVTIVGHQWKIGLRQNNSIISDINGFLEVDEQIEDQWLIASLIQSTN